MQGREKRQGQLWDWKAKAMKRSKKDGCWAQILEGLDWHAKTSDHCSVGTEEISEVSEEGATGS